MTEEKTARTCLTLPEDIWKWLKITAVRRRIPMYQLVIELVEEAKRREKGKEKV